jgi:hypothetical protein
MLQEKFLVLKSNLELDDSFDESIQIRHNAVRSVIENNNPGIRTTKLIGSLQRKTRIKPIDRANFDIDVLVVMGEFTNWLPAHDPNGVTAQRAMDHLHETVKGSKRYDNMNPQQDSPTVSIVYADDITVEFVPAYIDKIGRSIDGTPHFPTERAYWIPKNGTWELADYDYEANYISEQNAKSGGWLIPTMKMLKALKRVNFPNLGSFHLDVLASQIIPVIVENYKLYSTPITYPNLIREFFVYSSQFLFDAVKIPGSHSPTITLSLADSYDLTNKFSELVQKIDTSKSLSETEQCKIWKELFKDPFPV